MLFTDELKVEVVEILLRSAPLIIEKRQFMINIGLTDLDNLNMEAAGGSISDFFYTGMTTYKNARHGSANLQHIIKVLKRLLFVAVAGK